MPRRDTLAGPIAAVAAGAGLLGLAMPASVLAGAPPPAVAIVLAVLVFGGVLISVPGLRPLVYRFKVHVVLILLALGLAWWAVRAMVDGLRDGFPTAQGTVLAAACVAAALALLTGLPGAGPTVRPVRPGAAPAARSGPTGAVPAGAVLADERAASSAGPATVPDRRRSSRSGWVLIAVVVLGVVAVSAVPLTMPATAGDRTGVTATAVADRPTAVAWQRQFPGLLNRVVAAGPLVIAVQGDGTVTALDSATGRTVWTYRRLRRTAILTPVVSPDLSTVVVSFGSVDVALDVRTGKELWHRRHPLNIATATDHVVVYLGGTRAAAVDLRTGRDRWSRSLDCPVDDEPEAAPFADRVALPVQCGRFPDNRAEVRFLADRDGAEVGRAAYARVARNGGLQTLASTADLLLIRVNGQESRYVVLGVDGSERASVPDERTRPVRGVLGDRLVRQRSATDVQARTIELEPVAGGAPRQLAQPDRPNDHFGVWTRTHLVTGSSDLDRGGTVFLRALDGSGPVVPIVLPAAPSRGTTQLVPNGGQLIGFDDLWRPGVPVIRAGDTLTGLA